MREERPPPGVDNVLPNSEDDAFWEFFDGLAVFFVKVEPNKADEDGAPAPVPIPAHTSITGPAAFVDFFVAVTTDCALEVVPESGVRLFDGLFEGLRARKAAAAFLMTSAISSARAYASAD